MENPSASVPLVKFTSVIVGAYVKHHTVPTDQLTSIIGMVHQALHQCIEPPPAEERPPPAVPIKKSVQPDYIICLEDGRQFKTLKRYLLRRFNMTPDEYRARWGLPADYPMVAPNYSKLRSRYAQNSGLGRRSESEKE